MNPITWLKSYLQKTQDQVAEINKNKMVIDSSMVTKYLADMSTDHNYILLGVLPDVGSKGQNADDYKKVVTTQFMILKKTSYSDVNYDEFFAIFEEAYGIAQKVINQMLLESLEGCTDIRFLNTQSIQVIPVWNLASCNGCNILFSFDAVI